MKKRYLLVLLTLCEVRKNIKFFNMTGSLPNYATNLQELKELANHYQNKAQQLRAQL